MSIRKRGTHKQTFSSKPQNVKSEKKNQQSSSSSNSKHAGSRERQEFNVFWCTKSNPAEWKTASMAQLQSNDEEAQKIAHGQQS
jgi:hypothetical protein